MLKMLLRLRHSLRDSQGSSTLEYALMLGLLIGLLVLAMDLVGMSGRATFARVAASLEDPLGKKTIPADQQAESAAAESQARGDSLQTAVSRGLHIALTCCLAAALIIAWSSQRRRNLPPKPVEVLTVASVAPLSENLQAKFVDKRQQILRILAGNLHQLTHSQVAVRHVMTDRLAVVNPHVKVKDLRKRMQKEQLRHLLVCRTDGQLVGVISDRDLKGRNGGTAASIMTKEPIATAEETPISLAVTVMLQRHISCLPVLRDGKLCGVVTTTDLLMALQCTMQLVQQIADQLHEPAEPPVAALV